MTARDRTLPARSIFRLSTANIRACMIQGNRDVEPVKDETSEPSWADGLVAADDQTCAPAKQFVQHKAPQSFHVGRWPTWTRLIGTRNMRPVFYKLGLRRK